MWHHLSNPPVLQQHSRLGVHFHTSALRKRNRRTDFELQGSASGRDVAANPPGPPSGFSIAALPHVTEVSHMELQVFGAGGKL